MKVLSKIIFTILISATEASFGSEHLPERGDFTLENEVFRAPNLNVEADVIDLKNSDVIVGRNQLLTEGAQDDHCDEMTAALKPTSLDADRLSIKGTRLYTQNPEGLKIQAQDANIDGSMVGGPGEVSIKSRSLDISNSAIMSNEGVYIGSSADGVIRITNTSINAKGRIVIGRGSGGIIISGGTILCNGELTISSRPAQSSFNEHPRPSAATRGQAMTEVSSPYPSAQKKELTQEQLRLLAAVGSDAADHKKSRKP